MKDFQKYAGTWRLYKNATAFQGELHINFETRIIALEILIRADEEHPIPQIPYKGKIPYICGSLFTGANVLLYDCQTSTESNHIMQYTRQVIYAKYVFWGLQINSESELRFSRFLFDFSDTIAWSGLCKYDYTFSDEGDTTLIWKHEPKVSLRMDDNLSLSFYPCQGSLGGDLYKREIIASQYITVEFEYNTPVSVETAMEDAMSVRYLIGLGIGHKVDIKEAKYYHQSIYMSLQKEDGTTEKHFREASITLGTGGRVAEDQARIYNYVYTLKEMEKGNHFRKWCENYQKLKPVLDLYFNAYSESSISVEMLFLNLVQALETFHARFITNSSSIYQERVKKLLDSFCIDETNKKQWEDFLLDDSQKKQKKTVYLRSRLADLAFADGELPFLPNHQFPTNYIKKVVVTRNYYTHYAPAKKEQAFSLDELITVNGHLMALLEYHILILLEFDKSEVSKRTAEKIGRIDDISYIRNGTHSTQQQC